MTPFESRTYVNASANDDAQIIANAGAARWTTIVAALTPVLGQRGVAALYRRSLHLAGRAHPCLLEAQETTEPITFEKLREVLAAQELDTAVAAADASIETFHTLLGSLIGPALTQSLLGRTWSPLYSGSPAQDPL